MGQNLRLNCTAHLMQRLLLTAFFILAVSALAVGISQGVPLKKFVKAGM